MARNVHRLSPGFRALFASFVFFGSVASLIYPHLPSRMASHFNGSGRPDGYLSPAASLTLLICACVAFVFLFGVLHFGIRQIDPKNMNLPDTARWQDPNERVALRDNVADSMLWLAAASVAFMAIVFFSLYRANQEGARGLGAEFWIGLAAYAGFMLIWPWIPLRPLFSSDSS